MPSYLLEKLQKVQDQCVGIICPNTSLITARSDLNMLNVKELEELEHSKVAHKCLNNGLPVNLITNLYADHNVQSLCRSQGYNTRNKHLPNAVKCSDNRYKNCIFYKSFIEYGKLPQELKVCSTIPPFVSKYKKYILSQ